MSMNPDLGAPRQLTGLQQTRVLHLPELPPCLQGTAIRVEFGDSTTTIDPTCAHMVAEAFPHTFGQPLVHFLKSNSMVPDGQLTDEHPSIRTVDQIHTTEQVNAAMSTCCDLDLDGLVIIGGTHKFTMIEVLN
ncbi:hypothetical protein ABZP36_035191 [Zizania latifolia]